MEVGQEIKQWMVESLFSGSVSNLVIVSCIKCGETKKIDKNQLLQGDIECKTCEKVSKYEGNIYGNRKVVKYLGKEGKCLTVCLLCGVESKVINQGNFHTEGMRFIAREARTLLMSAGAWMDDSHYRKLNDILVAGDPKRRSLRGLRTSIFADAGKTLVNDHRSSIIRASVERSDSPPRNDNTL